MRSAIELLALALILSTPSAWATDVTQEDIDAPEVADADPRLEELKAGE